MVDWGIGVLGRGSTTDYLDENDVRKLVVGAFERLVLDGQRVLVIIPDSTRTMPLPLFFRLFHQALAERVAALDYLVALGTHQP